MNGLLLDTNVVFALRAPRRQPAAVQRWLETLDANRCWVASLTWMEIQVGIAKKRITDPGQAEILDTWFHAIHEQFQHHTLPFDDDAATVAAPLWLLRSRGTVDTLIAATALANNLDLATRNTTDFADLPDLAVLNPWADN